MHMEGLTAFVTASFGPQKASRADIITLHFADEKTESQHRHELKALWLTSGRRGVDPECSDYQGCGLNSVHHSPPPYPQAKAGWEFRGKSGGCWLVRP